MRKEFDYHFAKLGEFMTTEWTAKKLEFKKSHFKEIIEELRLENLTDHSLEIKVVEHDLFKHPKRVILKPKEVKHIKLRIPCNKIEKKHKSYFILKSKNQVARIPIRIEHIKG